MTIKLSHHLNLTLLAAGLTVFAGQGKTETLDNELQVARTTLQADRKATVAEAMQLTALEAAEFWPIYQQYQADMAKLGDELLRTVKDYAQLYPDIPDDRAKAMLKDLARLEQQRVDTRSACLKKIGKILPPSKTLRFAQVDSRLDLAMRIILAANIPLVPVEGQLTGQAGAAVTATAGVAGGSIVSTYELTATVAAIDKPARKLTLVDAKGVKTTVKVGPEAVNFDQIRVGDRLQITTAQELAISVTGPGESPADGGAQVVALAPVGAKPGALMAETTQVTAKVTALDAERRQATLQFEDGTTRTVAVRPDVDLSKRKVGDQVVIRLTEALAISVKKP